MGNTSVDKVTINGISYFKEQTTSKADIRIVILQRGWVMVGRYHRSNSDCTLTDAHVIRKWGTSKGLGELALNGPLVNTVLDKTHGVVEFDNLTVVATIACVGDVWERIL